MKIIKSFNLVIVRRNSKIDVTECTTTTLARDFLDATVLASLVFLMTMHGLSDRAANAVV